MRVPRQKPPQPRGIDCMKRMWLDWEVNACNAEVFRIKATKLSSFP